MSTFEGKSAGRSRIEKLVTALSIRTTPTEVSPGGKPEMESAHYAGMLAGMKGDPALVATAHHLLLYGLCYEPYHRKPLTLRLMQYLAPAIVLHHPSLQHSGAELREVVEAGLDAYVSGGTLTHEDAGRKGIKRRRWERLRPIYGLMCDRLADAEYLLQDHLSRSCS